MFPPELITVRLDIGWYRPTQTGMFAGEVYLSESRELVALEVHPFVKGLTLHRFLADAQAWQSQLVLDVLDPPPFP